MEKTGGWDQRQSLINELAQGRELARQLHIHLNAPSSSSSHESLDLLLQWIQHSYQKALLILTCNGASPGNILSSSESPPSLNASPTNDPGADPHASNKIRNSLPCWTEKVTVNPEMSPEGPPDDTFSWRKYGQKDIQGAKFPRGYYRCTQRNVNGCPATKLVQRSDDDPNMFEVTYRGNHTCTHNNNPPSLAPPPQINPPLTTDDYDYQINQHRVSQLEYPTTSSKASLIVFTENSDTSTTTLDRDQSFPSMSFDHFASINEHNHVIMSAHKVNFPEDDQFGPDHSFIFPSGLLQNGLHDGNPDLAPTSSGMSPFSRVESDPGFTSGNLGQFS